MRLVEDGDFAPFGIRSGLLATNDSAPLVADGGGVPTSAITVSTVAPRSAGDQAQAAAVTIAESYTYEGQRTDIAGGRGPRVTVGRMSDGKYGIRVWSSTGVLSFDQTFS